MNFLRLGFRNTKCQLFSWVPRSESKKFDRCWRKQHLQTRCRLTREELYVYMLVKWNVHVIFIVSEISESRIYLQLLKTQSLIRPSAYIFYHIFPESLHDFVGPMSSCYTLQRSPSSPYMMTVQLPHNSAATIQWINKCQLTIWDITRTRHSASAEIARVRGNRDVLRYSTLLILIPIESPYATLLLVKNTNLHPISPRFPVIAQNVSDYLLW